VGLGALCRVQLILNESRSVIQGLMQKWEMTLDTILTHAAASHGDRAVVTQGGNGSIEVSSYQEAFTRARTVSAALVRYGIRPGDRIGTLMWNDFDHFATWFGVLGIGAVMHTLNPRLGAKRIAWIAAHGGDRLIVCGEDLQEMLGAGADGLSCVERILVSRSQDEPGRIGAIPAESFERFLSNPGPFPAWGGFDENSAAGLCYTSGTTGAPKGVLYSHRSNMLHALTVNQPGGFGIGPSDVVLTIVPMFHANAWALPFIAPLVGAELVLPGRNLHGASLCRLINERGVTFAAGVPTVCRELLRHLDETGSSIPSLRRIVVGGSAPSRDLVERYERIGVEFVHAWGMTEMSPLGAFSSSNATNVATDDRIGRVLRQGIPPFPTQAEIFNDAGTPLSHDDAEAGSLKVRGPAVLRSYYDEGSSALDEDGWFDTGDIAAIDETGSIRLVDRAKDVIKSGGEWISSIELENLVMSHPAVRQAAVIGVPDEKWGERPLLIIEAEGQAPCLEELVEHMRSSVPAWWLPTSIAYRNIPLGATGKIDKLALRRMLALDRLQPANDHSRIKQ
jgi:fatty-acyl-CoA synthase